MINKKDNRDHEVEVTTDYQILQNDARKNTEETCEYKMLIIARRYKMTEIQRMLK